MNATRLSHPTLLAAVIAAVAALLTFSAGPALAQPDAPDREPPTAESIAQRAIDRIESVAERTEARVDAVEAKTLEALAGIDESRQATRLARRASGVINRDVASSIRAIRETAAQATAAITRLQGDPMLIDDVQTAAQTAIEDLRVARKDAIQAIIDAVRPNDPPSTD
ncbi:MAG: hypothetical protein AAGE65_13560 [Planctomycetota bacterium]